MHVSLPLPPPPPYQDENNEAEEEDDKDNGIDNREPVNLKLFWEEGLEEFLTITVCNPGREMVGRREGRCTVNWLYSVSEQIGQLLEGLTEANKIYTTQII